MGDGDVNVDVAGDEDGDVDGDVSTALSQPVPGEGQASSSSSVPPAAQPGCLWMDITRETLTHPHPFARLNHNITEPFRLEKASEIIESNL